MRTEVKTVTETVYVAMDGTEFKKENDCVQYEQSASNAFWSRLKKCIKELSFDDNSVRIVDLLIDNESGESTYYKFTPKLPEDVINFIGYCNAEGYVASGSSQWWNDKSFVPFTTYDELEVGKEYLVMMYRDGQCLKIVNAEKFTETFKGLVSAVFEGK